jgi:hypothetical protein
MLEFVAEHDELSVDDCEAIIVALVASMARRAARTSP